jgi:hypothetical protein
VYDHEIRTELIKGHTELLSRDWPATTPRSRLRLALGVWLLNVGLRLTDEPRSPLAHEALPRC